MLLLAVIVVFIAVIINLGNIAQLKTLTSVAAQSAAINMASLAGSYALTLEKQALGGEGHEEKCELAGWLGALLNYFWNLFMIIKTFVPMGPVGWVVGGIAALANMYTLLQTWADLPNIANKFHFIL